MTIDELTAEEVVVSAAPTPANITYSTLNVTPTSGTAPLNITANATVENTGGVAGDYNASFKVDETIVEWSNGTLPAGENVTASFTHTLTAAGTYNVTIDDLTATVVTVTETGAVSVTLYEGWNLIAVPVNDTNADTAAELALKIPGCKEVVKWNASTQTYDPYTKIVDDWTGTSFAITGGMGLFVNVEGDTTVGFTGDAWSCSP